MIQFSDHEKAILSRVGHGGYGKELIALLEKAKNQVCSLESLESGQDHNAAVEGRLLFKKLAQEFIDYLSFEKRGHPQSEGRETYE